MLVIRNANVNVVLVATTTNAFIFQRMRSFIGSMGVPLTWLDVK